MLKKKPKMYQLTPGNREHNLLISEANVLLLSNTDEELSTTKNEDGKKGSTAVSKGFSWKKANHLEGNDLPWNLKILGRSRTPAPIYTTFWFKS